MIRPIKLFFTMILFAALGFLVYAAPVQAGGMYVSPSSGSYDTTFILSADSFVFGEPVRVWVTTPTGATVGPQTLVADSHGAIHVSGQVPSGSIAGTYAAHAQGQTSGHLYSAPFTLTVPATVSYPDWKGEYYNNQNLSGPPVLVRNDPSIDFNWGLGSPDSSIPSDHFSVRWTRSQYLSAGTYSVTVTTDDGVRVWIGNTLVINAWYDQPATTHTANITLAGGTYPIRVEYYENAGAAGVQLSWTTAPSNQQAWAGYYFNNPNLSGSPVLTRQDAELNMDWGGSSPGAGIPGTNWSAKWDSTQYAPSSGNYAVVVTSDDGVRVWVDGTLVLDEWRDQPPTLYTSTFYVAAGWHNVHVEYYQHIGGSTLQVQFVGG